MVQLLLRVQVGLIDVVLVGFVRVRIVLNVVRYCAYRVLEYQQSPDGVVCV